MLTHRHILFLSYLFIFSALTAIAIRFNVWLKHDVSALTPDWIAKLHNIGNEYMLQTLDTRSQSIPLFRAIFPFILFIIIISFISVISTIILGVCMRLISISLKKKRTKYDDKIENLILQYIYSKNEKTVSRLRKYPQGLVIIQLYHLYNGIIGKKANSVKELFYELQLDRYVMNRVKSIYWSHRLKYFSIASAMQLTDATETAKKTIDCYMPLVRNAAETAFFNLGSDRSLDFLKGFQRTLSDWHQLHLYHLIIRNSIIPPDFSDYLDEENPSVVSFSLHMMRLFDQKKALFRIPHFLFHEDPTVRNQAILTIRAFNLSEAIPDLIRIFHQEDIRNQMEIIRTLTSLNTSDSMEFLIELMANQRTSIRIEILNKLKEKERDLLLKHADRFDDIYPVLLHISDKRIS